MNEYDFYGELEKTLDKKAMTERVLKKIFPNSTPQWNVVSGNDAGIDLTVEDYAIDVKYRKKDCQKYGNDDCALEIWSVVENKKLGWTLDASKKTDFVLWIWENTERHEIIPFQPLKKAFEINGKKWCKQYGIETQRTSYMNCDYHSQSVFVPRKDIWNAINSLYYGEETNENE